MSSLQHSCVSVTALCFMLLLFIFLFIYIIIMQQLDGKKAKDGLILIALQAYMKY